MTMFMPQISVADDSFVIKAIVPTPKKEDEHSKAEKAAMHRRIAAAPRSTETRSPSELASDRPSPAGDMSACRSVTEIA